MAISNDQKLDLLFKKVGFTKSKTSRNKGFIAEAIPSPTLIRGDIIWGQAANIPVTPPNSSTSVVQKIDILELTKDITVTGTVNNRTWLAKDDGSGTITGTPNAEIKDWIDPQFGGGYGLEVYWHNENDPTNAKANIAINENQKYSINIENVTPVVVIA